MAVILANKSPVSPSVFQPAALLREARRQKGLPAVDVPAICILDPDGDIVRRLRQEGRARPFQGWPCYHTQLDTFELAGQPVGIVGCAVGAPFAVLIAEELFASGCRLLLSLTSAGQIVAAGPTPYFVIIDRALRDEGTSYHYAAPSDYGEADAELIGRGGRHGGCADGVGDACFGTFVARMNAAKSGTGQPACETALRPRWPGQWGNWRAPCILARWQKDESRSKSAP